MGSWPNQGSTTGSFQVFSVALMNSRSQSHPNHKADSNAACIYGVLAINGDFGAPTQRRKMAKIGIYGGHRHLGR
ncbi:unnamed protein product [Linum trigynum]|uniref:Uncharacterized protein n=1 Tax=Linum trigynum TaxID=586398 RepID=A0AAV2EZI5_9ROSI